jgi:hypothetical protein
MENFADGIISAAEKDAACTGSDDDSDDPHRLMLMDFVEDCANTMDGWAAANFVVQETHSIANLTEKWPLQAEILREIIGNPFRPYPAPPAWPTAVIKLAEALYAGGDCSFALHDALLEAGHPKLGEHFQPEQGHPKGCWVVDLLLGKA